MSTMLDLSSSNDEPDNELYKTENNKDSILINIDNEVMSSNDESEENEENEGSTLIDVEYNSDSMSSSGDFDDEGNGNLFDLLEQAREPPIDMITYNTPNWMLNCVTIYRVSRIIFNLLFLTGSFIILAKNRNYCNVSVTGDILYTILIPSLVLSIINIISILYDLNEEYHLIKLNYVFIDVMIKKLRMICHVIIIFNALFLLIYCLTKITCVNSPMYVLLVTYIIVEFALTLLLIGIAVYLICCGMNVMLPSIIIRNFYYMPVRFGADDMELENMESFTIIDNDTHYILSNKNREITINDKTKNTCIICHINYNNNDKITYLDCNHYYHKECCDEWLKINKTCPMCRQAVIFKNNI